MTQSTQAIPIGVSLANCGGLVDSLEFYKFVVNQAEDVTAYAFRPRGPTAAGLDFFLVLNTIGSVASIASILWLAYDRFIASRKRDADDSAGIYITVRRPDGTAIDIFLGRNVLNQEDFTQRFELLIDDATQPDMREMNEKIICRLELDDTWVRIDRK